MSESGRSPEHVELMEALRALWKKLSALEESVAQLKAQPSQLAMKVAGKGATKPPNPQFTLLQGRMLEAWRKIRGVRYEFSGKDAKAIAALLRRSMTLEEITARWVRAMQAGCVSMFDFEMNFNKWSPSESSRQVVSGGTDIYAEKTK